jgi:hypothetical protein
MKKKMLIWIGAAVMATSMAAACSSKKPAGTTPVENKGDATGGGAYGGGAYGAPGTTTPEGGATPAPETPPSK